MSSVNDPFEHGQPAHQPRWQWPQAASAQDSEPESPPRENPPPENAQKHYPPHVCRICLETVLPTFQPPSEAIPEFLQPKARVVYESPDPEFGRLLRPCKCKGSSRYVHEGCLRTWRHADPGYSKRNFWRCPTCGFQYRLERLTWARWISSAGTQLTLTVLILLFTIFLLGFVADPIINLYMDPLDTIYYTEYWEPSTVSDTVPGGRGTTWYEHLAKGLASLGVLSFLKALLAISPWNWWHIRSGGVFGGGRQTGRSRAANISWVVILVGVVTFLWVCSLISRRWQD